MSLGNNTALGIDISDGCINLALLEKNKNGVKLLKAATGAVPQGAIENGNIENPAILTKAIKKLKAKYNIYNCPTAISLVANPAPMQILDIPKEVSGNIRQFVSDEVKHYAILPIQNTAIDYCGLKPSGNTDQRRALVVATDSHKITAIASVFRKAGLNLDAIEPPSLAYIRACYAKKIAQKINTNLLFVTVYNGVITLCVFANQSLEYIRTKQLEQDNSQPEKCINLLTEEINAIIQFYEFNLHNKCGKWEVTLLTNISNEILNVEIESLKNRLKLAELEIRTIKDAYLDTPVANTEYRNKPSAIAVGLAMKLLGVHGSGLNINLFPADVSRAKLREKQLLINANVAAAIFFLMILSIGFFNKQVSKVDAETRQKTPEIGVDGTRILLNEQTLLQKRIVEISDKLNCVNNTLNTGSFLNWGQILNEIKLVIPKMVRIESLSSKNNSELLIEGEAISYETVNYFVSMLNSCENIQSASLITTSKSSNFDRLLSYSISCSLIQQKGLINER